MDLGLTGRVVLVTGGSRGIGLACARVFATEGAHVALAARSRDGLDEARRHLAHDGWSSATFPADLSVSEQATALVSDVETTLGPIDVVVNAAGAAKRHRPEDLDAAAWQQGISAKFYPYVHVISAIQPRMVARKRGTIVNIIGSGGKVADVNHLSGGAANAALMLMTTGLAAALGPHGVRVNGINPGLTFTNRLQQALELESATTGMTIPALLELRQAEIPLRRYARPEEIAAMAAFLASDQASYVTGAIIPMHGGIQPVI